MGISLVLPLLICLWTLCDSTSYHLTWRKTKKGGWGKERGSKRKRQKKKKDVNKPPADFKPITYSASSAGLPRCHREKGLSFTFLPAFGSERMETRFGSHYSQFPGLRSRSSVSCQTQISHSSAHSESMSSTEPKTSRAYDSPLLLSLGMQCETNRGTHFPSATHSGCALFKTGRVHC